MKNGDPFLHMDRMVEASQLAIDFTEGYDEHAILKDDRAKNAVAMQIIVIGECAGKLARDFPDFSRQRFRKSLGTIIGMRNRIAHGYHDVNFRTVWLTVQTEMPPLLSALSKIYELEAEPFPADRTNTSGQD